MSDSAPSADNNAIYLSNTYTYDTQLTKSVKSACALFASKAAKINDFFRTEQLQRNLWSEEKITKKY